MKLRHSFRRLSIKWKLIVILSTIMLLISTISIFALRFVYQIYDRQVLHLSSQTLNLYSTAIENELRTIEQMTFGYFTQDGTQENLAAINYGESSYERYQAIQNLRRILLADAQSEVYISSVSYFDTQGHEYTLGSSVAPFDPETLERIQRQTADHAGITWAPPTDSDYNFFVARQIKDTRDLSSLGYVVVRINPVKLIQWVSSTWPDFDGRLLIFNREGRTIYSDAHLTDFDLDYEQLRNSAHTIQDLRGHDYLLTRVHSTYTDWTYFILLSYENIFQSIIVLRTTLIIAFLLLSATVLAIGIRFSGKITKPIIRLSKKMSFVEKGEFERVSLTQREMEPGDEITRLHNDFVLMVEKINHLIRENYVKQLLIKESELKALQAQIHPHFLYNTLESINWEARLNKQHKISTMVKALGELLRRAISSSDHITTVTEELQLLDAYMTIQKFRFEERLSFRQEVDPRLLHQRIVKMSLQPIVENAIKYGLELRSGSCEIKLRIRQMQNAIEIVVSDNGPGMSPATLKRVQSGELPVQGSGIGLKNINERIKLTFGEGYGLTIDSKQSEGTVVIMRIPGQKRETGIAQGHHR